MKMHCKYGLVDREGWASGPWDKEPDRINFTFPDFPGFRGLMLRMDKGHWCGYVSVPTDHFYYGKKTLELMSLLKTHGEISFAGEQEGVYCVGFDCNRSEDLKPGGRSYERILGTYRDVEFVKNKCIDLAKQLYES